MLLLTENDPFVSALVAADKYVSLYIVDLRRDLTDSGWDSAEMHRELVGQPRRSDELSAGPGSARFPGGDHPEVEAM